MRERERDKNTNTEIATKTKEQKNSMNSPVRKIKRQRQRQRQEDKTRQKKEEIGNFVIYESLSSEDRLNNGGPLQLIKYDYSVRDITDRGILL